jgi:hypothetical protein
LIGTAMPCSAPQPRYAREGCIPRRVRCPAARAESREECAIPRRDERRPYP